MINADNYQLTDTQNNQYQAVIVIINRATYTFMFNKYSFAYTHKNDCKTNISNSL